MLNIQILGFNCQACNKTYQLIETVAKELQIPIQLSKQENPQAFIEYQVLQPPGIIINDGLVFQGSCPSKKMVIEWLTAQVS